MPLSDNEEKILAEIEANIRKSDPGLAQHVEQSTVYRHSGRRIVFSVLGILALLIIIVFTFSSSAWPVAFVAFALMVIVGISLVDHVVKIGRAGVDDARKQAHKINPPSSWRTRRDS
ncbi:MAG TPA: DUF3040 domain-containing protein [Acidimicrobiia bacterium]|nr:DUF3040 domain-containing protein [Acidimicrobiia bacterium]